MTVEEFFHWMLQPENKGTRYELVEGSPLLCPLSTELDPWITVVDALQSYVMNRKNGSIALRGDGIVMCRNPDTVMTPDLMVFLTRDDPNEFPKQFTDEVPDLVVEIRPPALSFSRMLRRGERYVRAGRTRMLWIIDPAERAVFVGRPNSSLHVFDYVELLTGNGVLPDFACKVADLFALPGSTPSTP